MLRAPGDVKSPHDGERGDEELRVLGPDVLEQVPDLEGPEARPLNARLDLDRECAPTQIPG